MNIGDTLKLVPSVNLRDDTGVRRALPCRVVYIHPEKRFFSVEFRSEVTGQTFRESFHFPNRSGVIRETPIVDPDQKRRQFGPTALRRGGLYDTKG